MRNGSCSRSSPRTGPSRSSPGSLTVSRSWRTSWGPVIEAVRTAAGQAGISSSRELSARRAAAATLSLLWCDLVELEPGRLVRAWGARDLQAAWAGHLAGLMAVVESARDRLEARAEPGR